MFFCFLDIVEEEIHFEQGIRNGMLWKIHVGSVVYKPIDQRETVVNRHILNVVVDKRTFI
jgi:hypothetical protein